MLALRPMLRAGVAGMSKHHVRLLIGGSAILTYSIHSSPSRSLIMVNSGNIRSSSEQATTIKFSGGDSNIVSVRKSLWQRIASILRLLYHCGRLVLLGMPLLVTYPVARIADRDVAHWWWRLALTTGKHSSPAIIKFLQWASTRRDMFSPRFCNTFQQFHANCEVHSWSHTLERLVDAFGPSWSTHMQLDPDPIGSGVIAQVYQGRWMATNEKIAVKVIHPSVQESVALDLDLLWVVAGWVDYFLPNLSASVGMASFAEVMTSQLDLRVEAANLLRFQSNFATTPNVTFPTPMPEFVTSSVLVESFVDGEHINTAVDASSATWDRRQLAATTVDTFLRMLFLHNFAHGDIHPGNILVTRNGTGGIALLDAGIVNTLRPTDFDDFVELFHHIASKDGVAAGKMLLEKSPRHYCTDQPAFTSAIAAIVDRATKNLSLREVPVGELLQDVLEVCQRHHVALQGRFVSVVVSIGVLEGVGRLLDPELDILKIALPILIQAKFQQRLQ
ncbi:hypothetical protein DYB25_008698 [Aphanomyces astaci]|uniref:Protein kinase domain-containing protein n=1 Tax=Aphanomyces astaci TaxID=112090 RepID=A0A396ZWW6_APHAT|nr:hypothetical protein DYB25_008698 [Aphanomyces astaci]